jgi:hypothetical protein
VVERRFREAKGSEMSKWIPVIERLPCNRPDNEYDKNDLWVLASDGHGVWQSRFIIWGDTDEKPSWFCPTEIDSCGNRVVTHWMKLPEPPEMTK